MWKKIRPFSGIEPVPVAQRAGVPLHRHSALAFHNIILLLWSKKMELAAKNVPSWLEPIMIKIFTVSISLVYTIGLYHRVKSSGDIIEEQKIIQSFTKLIKLL